MSYEYDVALSFAGEDRKFVEDCAEILRSLNINVFYDNYEKEVLLGKNLYSYLADVYQSRARFAVVFVSDESIDLICTHPPYADIIKYSDGIDGDLSQLKVKDFLEEMKKVAAESYRVLKKDKFCAVLMGDTRQKGCMIPMSFDVMKIFQDAGFTLKELIIKEQHNCKATGYWKTNR